MLTQNMFYQNFDVLDFGCATGQYFF